MRVLVNKTTDYETVINKCYSNDSDLIEKYHKLAPTTISEAVEYTVRELNKGDNVVVYEINCDGEFGGYFAAQDKILLGGFFIDPKFRNKEFVQKFWRIVKSKFENQIYCGLFDKNEKAHNFVKRAGFKVDKIMKPDITLFKYN